MCIMCVSQVLGTACGCGQLNVPFGRRAEGPRSVREILGNFTLTGQCGHPVTGAEKSKQNIGIFGGDLHTAGGSVLWLAECAKQNVEAFVYKV